MSSGSEQAISAFLSPTANPRGLKAVSDLVVHPPGLGSLCLLERAHGVLGQCWLEPAGWWTRFLIFAVLNTLWLEGLEPYERQAFFHAPVQINGVQIYLKTAHLPASVIRGNLQAHLLDGFSPSPLAEREFFPCLS